MGGNALTSKPGGYTVSQSHLAGNTPSAEGWLKDSVESIRREGEMYQKIIARYLRLEKIEADPRHIEAWMRTGHGTLDALSVTEFHSEIRLGLGCIESGGLEKSEALAKSHGL